MDWNIKVYDIVDFRADEEPEDSLNSREKWSVIDDRVAHKTLIPIKFVLDGEKGAETETDGMPQSVPSPRCSRVAVALRSLPTPPPAPPSTPVPVERPKSPPLERKVRARAFAKDLGDNVHGAAIDASAIDEAVQAIRAQNWELRDSIAKMVSFTNCIQGIQGDKSGSTQILLTFIITYPMLLLPNRFFFLIFL